MEVTKNISKHIFRGYDIRGIYGDDLFEDTAYTVGVAYANILKSKYHINKCIVGHDNRLSSQTLSDALIDGITSAGVDVIDLGLVTSPMVYFANEFFEIYSSIVVTASHNPKEYNGFKISLCQDGEICGEEIEEFRDFIYNNELRLSENKANVLKKDISKEYADMLLSQFDFGKKLKVVVDGGNGTSSIIVHDIFDKLNLDVEYIFCESDGNFPNHHPDPSVSENMKQLIDKVLETNADLGIAFDGDADRVGVVDNKGRILPSDYYLSIMSRYILPNVDVKRVIFDVSCSKTLSDEVTKNGGEPVVYKTGNSFIKREMLNNGYAFGGEISGHTFFNDRTCCFDDGIYAGLRIIEVLSKESKSLSEIVDSLNKYHSTEVIKIKVSEDKKALIVSEVKNYCLSKWPNTNTIDGARVEFDDGFAIIRMSNTTPNLTLRFEANTNERLIEIQKQFEKIVFDIIERV